MRITFRLLIASFTLAHLTAARVMGAGETSAAWGIPIPPGDSGLPPFSSQGTRDGLSPENDWHRRFDQEAHPTEGSSPGVQSATADRVPRVNAPHFEGKVPYNETAIFWFGRITPTENYADVRTGYTDDELLINVAIFDRLLWYDTQPSKENLTSADAISLFLRVGGNIGSAPDAYSFKFVAQLNWWEERAPFQASYRGDGVGWALDDIPFTTSSFWRGNAPNDSYEDRGWNVTFHVPFASLGLSNPPPQGSTWGLGLILHDRDDAAGTPLPDKGWPGNPAPSTPSAWGQLGFGIPTYSPPETPPGGTVTIRHKLDGVTVADADVGGSSVCGSGLDFWREWPEANYAGKEFFNIQNQYDVADWPCFSKVYMSFPLDGLPAGKVILGATLTLHQFGNAGGGNWGEPPRSFIQVLTVAEEWGESTIHWNNAPLAQENISGTWVDPMPGPIEWPGVPWLWDVSRAVAQSYENGEPLRLALYSADTDYHSGKYFVSSDTGDWNEVGRPTLEVVWGDPSQPTTFADVPVTHPYYDEIEALYHAGYTAGCATSPLRFCPDQAMTRTESAVFVERGVHGVDVAPSEPPSSIFDDMDPATWGLKWATALWNDGYTVGCNADPLRFCPDRGHTRAEGAVFYLRMLRGADYLPPQPQGIFADVDPGAWHAKWDEAAYNASLIPACSPPGEPLRFCPDDPLTRGLAAYMMVQAKGLSGP